MPLFRHAWRALRERPLRVSLIIVLSVLAGGLEGFGVSLLVPVLQLIGSGDASSAARPVRWLLTAAPAGRELEFMLVFVVLVVVVQQSIALAHVKLLNGTMYGYEADLRRRLYRALLDARWEFFTKEKSGHIVDALTNQAMDATRSYQAALQFFGDLLVLAAYATLAFVLSWQMTLIASAGVCALVFVLRGRVARGSALGRAIVDANAELQSESMEAVAAAKLIKGSAAGARAAERFGSRAATLAGSKYRSGINESLLKVIFDALSVALLCLGMFMAVRAFSVPMEVMIVFLFVFYRISPRVGALQQLAFVVNAKSKALDRVQELIDRANAVAEPVGGIEKSEVEEAIAFSDVSFAYDAEPVLQHIDLVIPRNTTMAIVGPSGAGKSTIADLLMLLQAPTQGRLLLDDIDSRDVDVISWRSGIGYVAQDAVFFHASVFENLVWTAPEATREDVAAALEVAHASEFVDRLPEGMDTVIGDRGVRLSGGQRQRLALARALVRKPKLLILDEATSALDAESDEQIQVAISELARTLTIVIITHRLATVRGSHHVVFLEDGKVAEEGAWDDLVSRDGRFRKMMELQELSAGAGVVDPARRAGAAELLSGKEVAE